MNSYNVPISAKGIVFEEGSVWLRKNERNRWELPGGKVDRGEQPVDTVKRELREELGFEVNVVKLVHAWMLDGSGRTHDESNGVLVISYLCTLLSKPGKFEMESEAGPAEFKKFSPDEVEKLNMPLFYKDAIGIAQDELLRSKQ